MVCNTLIQNSSFRETRTEIVGFGMQNLALSVTCVDGFEGRGRICFGKSGIGKGRLEATCGCGMCGSAMCKSEFWSLVMSRYRNVVLGVQREARKYFTERGVIIVVKEICALLWGQNRRNA